MRSMRLLFRFILRKNIIKGTSSLAGRPFFAEKTLKQWDVEGAVPYIINGHAYKLHLTLYLCKCTLFKS